MFIFSFFLFFFSFSFLCFFSPSGLEYRYLRTVYSVLTRCVWWGGMAIFIRCLEGQLENKIIILINIEL